MKKTGTESLQIYDSLKMFADGASVPNIKAQVLLGDVFDGVEAATKRLREGKDNLIKEYFIVEPATGAAINLQPGKTDKEFNEKMQELMDMEIDIPVKYINPDLLDGIKIIYQTKDKIGNVIQMEKIDPAPIHYKILKDFFKEPVNIPKAPPEE